MKVQNIFPVSVVETNETLRERSRENGTLYVRIAITPNGGGAELSEEQKKLLSLLDDEEKELTNKGTLKRDISNIFRVSSFVDGLDDLSDEELSDENQDDLISQLSDLLKGENAKGETKRFIFTYFTFDVSDLLQGTEYGGVNALYSESGGVIRQRNNLYFGFFDDDDEAFSFMRSRLISDIEEEKLLVDNPTTKEEETPKQPAKRTLPKQPAKRTLSLKH